MLVVLNHIDTVPEDRRAVDARRRPPAARRRRARARSRCSPTSARTGEGIDELRAEIADAGRGQEGHPAAARGRPARARPRRLDEATGTGAAPARCPRSGSPRSRTPSPTPPACRPWSTPSSGSTRLRASRATGWPVTSWLSRLGPTRSSGCTSTSARTASSSPAAPAPRCPQADPGAARPRRHRGARAGRRRVRRAGAGRGPTPSAGPRSSRLPDLDDRLDRALAATDLGADRIPVWAGLVRVLQWLLLARRARRRRLARRARGDGLPAGAASPRTPDVGGFPVPTLLLVGGVVARACCWRWSAGCWSRPPPGGGPGRPTGGCATAVREVADELVVEPVRGRAARRTRRCANGLDRGAQVALTRSPSTGAAAGAARPQAARGGRLRVGAPSRRLGPDRHRDRDEETHR